MRRVVLVLAVLLVGLALGPYMLGREGNAALLGVLAPEYARDQLAVLAGYATWEAGHRLGGAALVLLGLVQMLGRRGHRWTGYAYAALAPVMASGGSWMVLRAPFAPGEVVPTLLFAALLVGFTAAGIVSAVRRDLPRHRLWMARSYAVVLGPVVVRMVYVAQWAGLGVPEREAMAPAFWVGWSLPLVVHEVWRSR